MALSFNNVVIAGALTRDPQVRFLQNEQAVCNFSLAINRRFKKGNGEAAEEVTFVDCEAWGRTAELIGQYLQKGRGALVAGRLKLDTWDDGDGKKRSRLKVVAESVQFTDGKPKDDDSSVGGSKPPQRRQPRVRENEQDDPSYDDEPPF